VIDTFSPLGLKILMSHGDTVRCWQKGGVPAEAAAAAAQAGAQLIVCGHSHAALDEWDGVGSNVSLSLLNIFFASISWRPSIYI
jgi:predicted phosphodiesterase